MKKTIAILCALAICFSLAACGGKSDSKKSSEKESVTEEKRSGLQVVTAFVSDNDVNVVVENNYAKTVTGFDVAYVGYDNSGKAVQEYHQTDSISSVKIANGQRECVSFYDGYDFAYVDVIITSVTFEDGKTTENRGVDMWSEMALESTFSVDEYKDKLASLGEEAVKTADNDYLKITATFVYDNYLNIVAENLSDKTIIDFQITYICYDSNGLVVTKGYETGNVSAANLVAGAKDSYRYYEPGCAYARVIVSSITFSGDEIWENPDAAIWAVTRGDFSVDEYNAEIAAMAANAKSAETNPYITIVSTRKFDNNRYSNSDDLDFSVKNTSDKTISSAKFFVLQYDSNGYAIDANSYNDYCKNGDTLSGTLNLMPGTTNGYNASLYFEPSCSQFKIIPYSVTFEDGTVWDNPYLFEWILVNSKNYTA